MTTQTRASLQNIILSHLDYFAIIPPTRSVGTIWPNMTELSGTAISLRKSLLSHPCVLHRTRNSAISCLFCRRRRNYCTTIYDAQTELIEHFCFVPSRFLCCIVFNCIFSFQLLFIFEYQIIQIQQGIETTEYYR